MKEETVRSVERAFAILKTFSHDESKLKLTEIAAKTGLSVTTALRLIGTLEKLNLLQRHSDREYSFGTQVYLLGSIAKAHFRPQQVIYPYMKDIRDRTKEAVSLYGIEDEERVCYAHVESLLTMRCVMRVGDRAPLWAGAGGKALLAFLGDEAIEREIRKIHYITSTTICDPEAFRKDLLSIRALGYSVSWGEREEGILSIAVPIFNRQNRLEYTFSVAGPATRFTERVALALIPCIQTMCREIALQI